MPIQTPQSPTVVSVDTNIQFDMCLGKIYVDIRNTVFRNSGNVLGAKVSIINPYGIEVKPFATAYDIFHSDLTAIFSFDIPSEYFHYQFGDYKIMVMIESSDLSQVSITKVVTLKSPNLKDKSSNYAILGASIDANCTQGYLFIQVDRPPVFAGSIGQSAHSYVLSFPTGTQLPAAQESSPNFRVPLFAGVYLIKGQQCVTYNSADGVSFKVLYKVEVRKRVFCNINSCAVSTSLRELYTKAKSNCSSDEKEEYASIMLESVYLLKSIELLNQCGEDPTEFILDLQSLIAVGCEDFLSTAPIIGTSGGGSGSGGCYHEVQTRAAVDGLALSGGCWVRVETDETNNGDKTMYLYTSGNVLEYQYTIA